MGGCDILLSVWVVCDILGSLGFRKSVGGLVVLDVCEASLGF